MAEQTEQLEILSRMDQFHNSIAYHKLANNPEAQAKFESLRRAAAEFGDAVFVNTEASREQSIALTHIEDALMWAIKQVAINLPTE